MAYGRKLLLTSNLTSNATPSQLPAAPPVPPPMEAEFVVVLAALLCAIVCVLALIVVARCAWLRGGRGGWIFGSGNNNDNNNHLANKGLKKKVLNTLPKYTHKSSHLTKNSDSATADKSDASPTAGEVKEVDVEEEDCAICLAEYIDGDEIRVLPQCGHRFHVPCIDTWLASHSSCPSCRQILVPIRCQKCGECPVVRSGGDGGSGGGNNSGKLRPNSSWSTPSPVF